MHKVLCLPFAVFALFSGGSTIVFMLYVKPGRDGRPGIEWLLGSALFNLVTLGFVVYFYREDKDFRVHGLSKVTFIAIIVLAYALGVWAAAFAFNSSF